MQFCALNVGKVRKMDYQELLNLIDKLDQSSVAYVKYKDIVLSKEVPQSSNNQIESKEVKATEIVHPTESGGDQESLDIPLEVEGSSPGDQSPAGTPLLSPMVGVAYLQPSPDKDPFVQVGDTVEEGDTVIIIEAMKLMTEIKADKSGEITEILVEDGEVVEYDQPLIRIK